MSKRNKNKRFVLPKDLDSCTFVHFTTHFLCTKKNLVSPIFGNRSRENRVEMLVYEYEKGIALDNEFQNPRWVTTGLEGSIEHD